MHVRDVQELDKKSRIRCAGHTPSPDSSWSCNLSSRATEKKMAYQSHSHNDHLKCCINQGAGLLEMGSSWDFNITFHYQGKKNQSKITFWILDNKVAPGRIPYSKQLTLTLAILSRKKIMIRELWTSLHNLCGCFKSKAQKSNGNQRVRQSTS